MWGAKGASRTTTCERTSFEELWHNLGNENSVCDAQWPKWDEKYLVESSFKYAIQIQGKVRLTMDFAADAQNADIEKAVLAHPDAQKWIQGKTPKKVIIVPKKIVNIVL